LGLGGAEAVATIIPTVTSITESCKAGSWQYPYLLARLASFESATDGRKTHHLGPAIPLLACQPADYHRDTQSTRAEDNVYGDWDLWRVYRIDAVDVTWGRMQNNKTVKTLMT
jgi:hypothetical protein